MVLRMAVRGQATITKAEVELAKARADANDSLGECSRLPDLKEAGPLVIAAPPNVIGMFTDFFQRTITDVGAIGPDRARGGLYLLLPPDYDGEVPKGYFTFKSRTHNVFLFFRTIMARGDNGPDPKPAVALAEQTRVYPLWAEKAVETAPKMILATRQLGRPDGRNLYYKDRQYENVWAGGTSEWLQDGCLDVSQRAGYFQIAYSTAPAMVMRDAGRWLQVSSHSPGCAGRVPQRIIHLQTAPAAASTRRAVLGSHSLQHHRRNHAGNAATFAVDQRLQQGSDQWRRLDRFVVWTAEACRCP